jgi:hypothetical protein
MQNLKGKWQVKIPSRSAALEKFYDTVEIK